jgi:hypothetical protein
VKPAFVGLHEDHPNGRADTGLRSNSIAETRRLPPRRERALASACSCTAPRNGRDARLLQFSAGVAIDLGAQSNFDDLWGFPAHKPFLLS